MALRNIKIRRFLFDITSRRGGGLGRIIFRLMIVLGMFGIAVNDR